MSKGKKQPRRDLDDYQLQEVSIERSDTHKSKRIYAKLIPVFFIWCLKSEGNNLWIDSCVAYNEYVNIRLSARGKK